MKLSSMRFKSYVWPHNPRVYEISYKKDIAAHRVPFGLYRLQHMGRQHRVLRGQGEFVGPGAYEEFKKLATVFYETTPGVLVHPLWMTTTAYFAALGLRQEPVEDYVAYSFEFWECFEGYEGAAGAGEAQARQEPEYHTVRFGERLWTLAKRYDLSVEALLRLNPQVRNPNALTPGRRLRVR